MRRTLFLSLILMLLALPVCAAAQEGTTMDVIHATDLHYISPALTDRGAYFKRMVDSGDGKVMMYSEELAEAFVEQVIMRAPDALILSGDLTFNGAYRSHEDFVKKLARIEAAGISVYALPGNHDVNCTSAACFEGEGFRRTEGTDARQFAALYGPYGYDEALSRDAYSLSYTAALSEALWLLMIDVNAVDSPGTVMSETIAWARAQLKSAQERGVKVIAVSHQNLMVHSPLFPNGFSMNNHERLLELYQTYGVALNLSGHMHMQHTMRSGGVTEIATSALSVLACAYGVMTIEAGTLEYGMESVDVAAWARRHGLEEENLLAFADYARDYFLRSGGRDNVEGEGTQGRAPAQTLPLLNAAYFSGRLDDTGLSAAEIAQLEALDGFWGLYVRSVTAEGARDHTRCTLAL